MAQSSKSGKKSSGSKSGKSGSSGSKKSSQSKNSTQSKNSASKQLDSVRGSAQRQSSRAQDAARKAAGRTGQKPAQTRNAEGKTSAPKKNTGKSGTAAASKPATKKTSGTGKSAKKRLPDSWKRMLLVAAGVLICVGGAIKAVSCANSQVDYRQAVMVTLSDNIETTGIAIRDERIITSDRQGVIVSTIENGGKVSKGETVANIFNSADAARAHERMEEIKDTLERFESMETAGEESASEVTALEKAIREELLSLSELIFSGDVSGASEASDELLYLLNKTQVATRVVEDFSDRVGVLETELAQLEAKYPDDPGRLKSPLSGYYINTVDGYEALLSADICASLTPEKLDEIMTIRSEPSDSSVVGKIANDYIWYMACEVSAEDADRLEKNKDGSFKNINYKLYLTYSELDSITAKLVGVNTGADASRKILIFECSYMVSELSTVRIQPVTIELSSYSGIEVSEGSMVTREVTVPVSGIKEYDIEGKEALARAICPQLFAEPSGSDAPEQTLNEEDPRVVAARRLISGSGDSVSKITEGIKLPDTVTYTQRGVFIIWGNEIKFRRAFVVYQEGDKVLCRYNVDSGFLKMYDKVVDDPGEVYDGQIINVG